jgi:hypothetical protein
MMKYLTAEDNPVLAKLWDNNDDAVYDSVETSSSAANGGNVCLCCGRRAEHYGHASVDSTGIIESCSKEVCVLCLETGCWGQDGKGCFGYKLRDKSAEWHQGCAHEEAE